MVPPLVPSRMKAVVLRRFGGPEAQEYTEVHALTSHHTGCDPIVDWELIHVGRWVMEPMGGEVTNPQKETRMVGGEVKGEGGGGMGVGRSEGVGTGTLRMGMGETLRLGAAVAEEAATAEALVTAELEEARAGAREEPFKGRWEFPVALLSCVVGLGKVWRFPALVCRHGSGFLLAYVLAVALVGWPLMLLEAGLGQFTSVGPLKGLRRMLPLAEGVSWLGMYGGFLVVLSYSSLISQALLFLFASIESPWKRCDTETGLAPWNKPGCWTLGDREYCRLRALHTGEPLIFLRGQCVNEAELRQLLRRLQICVLSDGEEKLAQGPGKKRGEGLEKGLGGRRRWFLPPTTAADAASPVAAALRTECHFRLHLYFNSTLQPIELVHSRDADGAISKTFERTKKGGCVPLARYYRESVGAPEEGTAAGLGELFQHWETCENTLAPTELRHGRLSGGSDGGELQVVDLSGGAWPSEDWRLCAGRPDAAAQQRADCLAAVLAIAAYDDDCRLLPSFPPPNGRPIDPAVTPPLGCVLLHYCQVTFPLERLSLIDCVRRSLKDHPLVGFSALQFHAHFGGKSWQAGETLEWSSALVGAHGLTWLIVGVSVLWGPRGLARTSLFTSGMSLVLSLSLCLTSAGLRSHVAGVAAFVRSRPCQLANVPLWEAALQQAFYSLSLGMGTIWTLGSHNAFRRDVVVNTGLVAVTDTLVSMMAGLGGFAVLAHAAEVLELPLEELLREGAHSPSLSFVLVPQLSGAMAQGHLIAVAFFLLLCLLGLGSLMTVVEMVPRALWDERESLGRLAERRLVVGVTCGLCFLLSLPMASRQGLAIAAALDGTLGAHILPLCVLGLLATVTLGYGTGKLLSDMAMMLHEGSAGARVLGSRAGLFLQASWWLSGPVCAVLVLVSGLWRRCEAEWGGREWLVLGLGLVPPLLLVLAAPSVRAVGLGLGGLRRLLRPTASWGPLRGEDRRGRYATRALPRTDSSLHAPPPLHFAPPRLRRSASPNSALGSGFGSQPIDPRNSSPNSPISSNLNDA